MAAASKHREQREDPGEARLGRAEPEQHGIGDVALGEVGGPQLPVAVKRGQSIGDPHELVAHEDLGSPGRHPGAALHQGDERLATVEGLVDRRQVTDLEGDGDRSGRPGENDEDVVAPARSRARGRRRTARPPPR